LYRTTRVPDPIPTVLSSVADPHWFLCGSGHETGSSILLLKRLRIRIRIQGFDDQILEKFTAEKNMYIFLYHKLHFTYLKASIKDVQTTGEIFIPQKRTYISSKLEFSSRLWVIFALMDPEPDPHWE
jgi:hypothetical protein